MKFVKRTSAFVIALMLLASILVFESSAAVTRPTVKGDPINGQILPFYEVWLHWYDVPDEHHYTMTIRDLGQNGAVGDAGPLIYDGQYVAQNSTYFVVPTSKLVRGHHYRWCVNSYDANGNRKAATAQYFAIESGSPDSHIETYSYMTNYLEYFVYAESSGYDSILNTAAQNWNGIANVSLNRTSTPVDGNYEVEIFESPSPANATIFGSTTTGLNSSNRVVRSTVYTYRQNIVNWYSSSSNLTNFYIKNREECFLANAMHEIGHALLLKHTEQDNDDPGVYDLSTSIYVSGSNFVPLIMNDGPELGKSINVVDRDHLRIKWGA